MFPPGYIQLERWGRRIKYFPTTEVSAVSETDANEMLDELVARVSELKTQVTSEVGELDERVSRLEEQVFDDE